MLIDPPDDDALGAWFDELFAWDAARGDLVPAPRSVAYGSSREQVADLWLPDGARDAPVVVSIHGATSRSRTAVISTTRSCGSWCISDSPSGTSSTAGRAPAGSIETTGDVWAAVDALQAELGPTAGRVAVFGHSAGGYLAEWLAPHPAVELVIPVAAASDLAGVVRAGWDDGAVSDWLGADPDDAPDLYRTTDLTVRLPAGATHVLVHGTADQVVSVEQSRRLAAAIRDSGDPAVLVELDGDGHYAFLDPREGAFTVLRDHLENWRRCNHR